MIYLDQCGNVQRDIIKLLEETNDEQRFDFREPTTKEDYSRITRQTNSTGLGNTGSTREGFDGRGKE